MLIIIKFAMCQNLCKIHSVGKEIHRVGLGSHEGLGEILSICHAQCI